MIKEKVKDRNGKIALSGNSLQGCCGPAECGSDNNTILVTSPLQNAKNNGYDIKELEFVPESSILGVGCGAPVNFADIHEGEVIVRTCPRSYDIYRPSITISVRPSRSCRSYATSWILKLDLRKRLGEASLVENEIISIKPQQQQEVTEVQPEENLAKAQEVGSGNGTRIDTDTSPPQPEQSANTITSEPGSTTASHTSPQSFDTHETGEDSMSPRSTDKSSACENCSAKDIRIKKLEDGNRELGIRCHRAESDNTKLVLQLTSQGKYINELLNQGQDKDPATAVDIRPGSITSLSSITDDSASHAVVNLLSHPSDKYIGQECPSCLELQDKVTQLSEALQRISMQKADQIPAF